MTLNGFRRKKSFLKSSWIQFKMNRREEVQPAPTHPLLDPQNPKVKSTLNAMNYEIAKHVARNVDEYAHEKSDLLKFLISSDMRQMTINILSKNVCKNPEGDGEHYENLLIVLKRLLDHETKFFDTGAFLSHCQRIENGYRMQMLLRFVPQCAPNLICLVIDDLFMANSISHPTTIDAICSLKQLRCLTIKKDFFDKDVILNRFCKEIPFLRYIDAPDTKIDCFIHIQSGIIKNFPKLFPKTRYANNAAQTLTPIEYNSMMMVVFHKAFSKISVIYFKVKSLH
ncbi:Hypothetical predicted protein [Cloeon dipterum]|uniref:Uncharacterized protein n=1 Tax=Cloeon dipterum TaxID=197152 RepID=A0A8S1DH95_9INSE|nr:Hypothetical predicted protein [Cloeon dipterum]